jgi:uncharacterized protein YjbJ (UPF0337 family)
MAAIYAQRKGTIREQWTNANGDDRLLQTLIFYCGEAY